jgi:hypothetical protein
VRSSTQTEQCGLFTGSRGCCVELGPVMNVALKRKIPNAFQGTQPVIIHLVTFHLFRWLDTCDSDRLCSPSSYMYSFIPFLRYKSCSWRRIYKLACAAGNKPLDKQEASCINESIDFICKCAAMKTMLTLHLLRKEYKPKGFYATKYSVII